MKSSTKPSGSTTASQPTRIQSVQRATSILRYVVEHPDGASATEIARALELSTPTTFHLLNTLVDEGMLLKYDRRYGMGPTIGIVADAYMRHTAPPTYFQVPLRELAEQSKETVYVTAWRNGDVAVLAVVEGTHPLRAAGPHTGYCGDAHARAAGKCLLSALDESSLDAYLATHQLTRLTPRTITTEAELRAELQKVQAQGFARDDEEFHARISCLAVPVVHEGRTLGAFSIASFSERLRDCQEEYLEALRTAAGAAVAGIEASSDQSS